MQEATPELAVISALDPEGPLSLSLASQLLEHGIHFTGLEHGAFPAFLPQDLAPFKALLIQASLYRQWLEQDRNAIARIEKYVSSRGPLYLLEDPRPEWDKIHCDRVTSDKVYSLITHAGLTTCHSSWAAIQDRRPISEMIAGFKDRLLPYLDTCGWGEFNLHFWKAALRLLATGRHEDVREAMRACLRRLFEHMPPGCNHNEVSGMFAAAWLWRETGERGPLDRARALMDRIIARRPRIAGMLASDGFEDDPLYRKPENRFDLKSTSRRTVVWTENLHMLCPGLAALSRVLDDSRYLDEAMRIARYIREYHQDRDGLLFHCTRTGRPFSSKWARGQAHALYGLLYMIEEMEASDPRRAELIETVRAAGRGLKACQDPVTGLWRNVLDMPLARIESSGSICFLFALARGIREGWLERSEFGDSMQRAFQGLRRLYWRGGLAANCRGTGTGHDPVYYLARMQGWGRVPWFLMALAEIESAP